MIQNYPCFSKTIDLSHLCYEYALCMFFEYLALDASYFSVQYTYLRSQFKKSSGRLCEK